MRALLTSRAWPVRALRIAVLAALGWWLVGPMVQAQLVGSSSWETNFDKALVDLDEIISGGPPKDGIPSVDEPQFVDSEDADAWLDPKEPVIALEINGDARAYPLQILIYHEIVNDEVGGHPVSVTFCPLCNASIVFDRQVDGRVLDFGTTGKLRKSDLVMYDRQTESWWQQITGRAIVGNLAGTVLEKLPANIVAYRDFKAAYPDGVVLSRDTGYRRPYGRNPYRGYDNVDSQPFLMTDPVDPRLPPMERVLNVTIDGTHVLYPFSRLEEEPVINDRIGDVPVVVLSREGTLSVLDAENISESRTVASGAAYERRAGGRVLTFAVRDGRLVDEQTGSEWDLFGRAVRGPLQGERLQLLQGGEHFAFAWLAFNPDSRIYGGAVE